MIPGAISETLRWYMQQYQPELLTSYKQVGAGVQARKASSPTSVFVAVRVCVCSLVWASKVRSGKRLHNTETPRGIGLYKSI